MKKNFVKKLALGLALVMAVTSVPASSEAAAKPGFKSEAVKVRVGQTKKYSTENSKKYSVKFVIGNKKVATIEKTGKAVKVTGVAEGTTKLRAEFKSYSTKKVTKVRIPVTVLAAKEEAPVVTTAELASVKQTASNAFEVTFTADASKNVTAESFKIESADGVFAAYVKDVEWSTDGKSAIVTTFGNFIDKTVYNVTCNEKVVSFTASVGAVVSAVINTAQAQANVPTRIEFTLFDAAGMDVTSNYDVNKYVMFEIDGDYVEFDDAKASRTELTMDEEGATATITLTYDALDGSNPVTATGKVTCIPAQAAVASKEYFTKVTNSTTVPRIYLNSFAPANVIYDNDVDYDFVFAALDKDGDAIEFEEIEVESSNENVITVSGDVEGKFSRIVVTPEKAGTAKVVIKATKNEVTSLYAGTVIVKAEPVLSSVSLDKSSIAVSTLAKHDNDEVVVTLKDQYGNPYADASVSVAQKDEGTDVNAVPSVSVSPVTGKGYIPVELDNYGASVDADSYVVEVTVTDNNSDKEVVKRFSVKSKEATSTNAKYKVELSDSVLDVNPEYGMAMTATTVKFAKYLGSVFAGYETFIASDVTVKLGNDTYGVDLTTEGAIAAADVATTPSGSSITLNSIKSSGGKVVLVENEGIAEAGTYRVTIKKASKEYTNKFTVRNSMEMPTVEVLATTVDAADEYNYTEYLKTDVDVLNNDSTKILGLLDKDHNVATENANGKTVVKYVKVVDTIYDLYEYHVPVSRTFKFD